MSELTLCNYCSLRAIKRSAKAEGKKVKVIIGKDFGLGEGRSVLVDGKKMAWFMELTDHCVC